MAYKYPYGNRDTINLDWFINEFQKLKAAWEEERAGIEGALDEEIARAEAALADVFAARDTATAAATAASQSADSARGYSETATAQANAATLAAQGATTARSDALAAQSAAEAAASNASGFASNASTSANAADTSAQSAAQSVINARTAQSAAAQSATLADSARQAAQTAQTGAETAATNAATSADNAETAATSIEESAQQITTNTNDISDLKESFIQMPLEYLTKKLFGDGNFLFSRYSRKVERIGNRFITTHLSGSISDGTRYNCNLFGDFRAVSGATLDPLEGEFIPITDISTICGCVLYRDYNASASSPDGIRVVLADDNNNVLLNVAITTVNTYTVLLVPLRNYIEQNPTASKIALYYYSADASTHEAILGIYPIFKTL